jgi:hypothetical protein
MTNLIEQMVYQSPQILEADITPEGMLCASTIESTHDEMDYIKYEW